LNPSKKEKPIENDHFVPGSAAVVACFLSLYLVNSLGLRRKLRIREKTCPSRALITKVLARELPEFIRVSLVDSPVLRTPFSLLTIEITFFSYTKELDHDLAGLISWKLKERESQSYVLVSGTFFPQVILYNVWKRGEAPLGEMSQSFLLYTIPTKEKRSHS